MNFNNKGTKKIFWGVVISLLIIPMFIILFCVLIYALDACYDVVKKVMEAILKGDIDLAKYHLKHDYLYVFMATGLLILIQFFKSLFDGTIKKYLDKKATDFYKFIERKTN